MCIQCTEKGEVISPYDNVQQWSQSSNDMPSTLRAGEEAKPQASHKQACE